MKMSTYAADEIVGGGIKGILNKVSLTEVGRYTSKNGSLIQESVP